MPPFIRTLFVRKKLTFLDKILLIIQGFIMGIVELIPGVGMSTISLTFGIYNRYIKFLHNLSLILKNFPYFFFKNSNRNKKELIRVLNNFESDFGIYLLVGIVLGIFLFSKFLGFIFYNFPAYTNAILFGLMLASISVPLHQIKKITFSHKFIVFITFVIFFFLFGLNNTSINNISYVPSNLVMFITGFLSVFTLLLPGLGGSFIFLMFGNYQYVLKLIHEFSVSGDSFRNAIPLFILIFGFLLGFNIILRSLKYFIRYYKDIFMSVLAGIMLASLRILYPFVILKGQEKIVSSPSNMTGVQIIIIIVLVTLSYGIAKLINVHSKPEDPVEDL